MTVCVIPARGGSKRIPRKNIRPFCGKPMIAWSIEVALASGCFSRLIVSTDDAQIANASRKLGAEVPFLREAALADDHTPTVQVMSDAVARLDLPGDTPVCCLYATAPFVSPQDLRAGMEKLHMGKTHFVLAVTNFAYPIQRALCRDVQGHVAMRDPAQAQTRSQDLEEAWHDAGQFYWARAMTWSTNSGMIGEGAYGLALPRHRVQDIDNLEDWTRAEYLMRILQAEDTS